MEISEEILEFLNRKDVQNALVRNDMQELYRLAKNLRLSAPATGEFTSILMQAGVDPLEDMIEIPAYFLYEQKDIKSFNIPIGITGIGRSAFVSAGLESVTIPDSVREIGTSAFSGCENLKTVELPTGVELYMGAFDFSGLESVELKDVKLRDIIIFYNCKQLKSVVIKGDTPVIPTNTFEGCFNLTHVELPASLKGVESSIFLGCSRLRKIDFAGTMDQWKDIKIGKDNAKLFNCKIICSDGILKYDKAMEEWVKV